MMVICRGVESEERLEQAMDMCRGEQIVAARDQRDPLNMIVEGDSEMIARSHFLARQHRVAETFGLRSLHTAGTIAPDERPCARQCLGEVEAEGKGPAGRDAHLAHRRREM